MMRQLTYISLILVIQLSELIKSFSNVRIILSGGHFSRFAIADSPTSEGTTHSENGDIFLPLGDIKDDFSVKNTTYTAESDQVRSLPDRRAAVDEWQLEDLYGAENSGNNVVGRSQKFMAHFTEWLVARVIRARSQFVSGLSVRVNSKRNRSILRGRVDSIGIKFDRIAYGQIWCTGGGSLYIKNLNIGMRRFLFQEMQSLRTPYEIYGEFFLTQSDIVNSRFIKRVFKNIVDIVIKRALRLSRDILDCDIKRVTIRGKKIYLHGEADIFRTEGGAIVPFEISTGVGLRGFGQVVYLSDLTLILNPESVLRTVLPVITTSVLDVDIGEDCFIDSFEIADKHVSIRAHSRISPLVTFEVVPRESRARFRYDMAAVMSNLMRFSGKAIGGQSPNKNPRR